MLIITDEASGILYQRWGPGLSIYGHGWSYQPSGDDTAPFGYIYLRTDGSVVSVHEGPTGDPTIDPLIHTITDATTDELITLHPCTGDDAGTGTVQLFRGPTGSGFDDALARFALQPRHPMK